MSRLILSLVVVMVCLSSSLALAGEPVNRDGQWGLGANTGGLALRYWTSDGMALQLFSGLRLSKDGQPDSKSIDAGIGVVPTLSTRGNLRLEGLANLAYSRYEYKYDETYSNSKQTSDTYSASIGLGIEYYFDELPNLTFGANLIGVRVSYSEYENNETKTYPKRLDTFGDVTFGLVYYF